MIIVTGGAGFIGTNMIRKLNKEGREDIVIVDTIGKSEKWENLVGCKYADIVSHHDVNTGNYAGADVVIHLGGLADTEQDDFSHLMRLNYESSKMWFQHCHSRSSLFIYASSASTYGQAKKFDDTNFDLKPTNRYGYSKHLFDLWARRSHQPPPYWYGLKFFNVYGPYEKHKGRMGSVHTQWIKEVMDKYKMIANIQDKHSITMYKDHREGTTEEDWGMAKRDFIYVDDVTNMIWTIIERANAASQIELGIYNVGTGKARTFRDVATAIFNALDVVHGDRRLSFEDMPAKLRGSYQHKTQAEMERTNRAFNRHKYTTLEGGVKKLVAHMKKVGEI